MSALAEMQRRFQAYVLGSAGTPPSTVAGTRAATAVERLRVYGEAVRLRFLEVLGEDYPGLHGLLGEAAFEALGRAYVDAHPSRHPSIRWFGRELPAFLESTPPWREQHLLAEMAAFEWAKGELVDAADSAVLAVEDIAVVPPDEWAGMRPRLKPAVRRLALAWNVPALWSAIDRGEAPPPPAREEPAVHWLLWRQDISIRWRSIGAEEAWALGVCAEGEDFGALCAGLSERCGEDAAPLLGATYLKQWVTDGLLGAV